MSHSSIGFKRKKRYALLVLKWCKENFGSNERKKKRLVFDFTKSKRDIKNQVLYGSYCFYQNKITIYGINCATIYDVVSTVIHEYTHYLQSRTRYKNYEENYYYSTNPYEREAKRNEEKYTKTCIKDIKKLIG